MHMQPPFIQGQPLPTHHDGDTRHAHPYSDSEQCVLCDRILPLAPLPEADLDDTNSSLAWAVAFAQRPPSFTPRQYLGQGS